MRLNRRVVVSGNIRKTGCKGMKRVLIAHFLLHILGSYKSGLNCCVESVQSMIAMLP